MVSLYNLLFTVTFALMLKVPEGDSTKRGDSDSKLNNGQVKRSRGVGRRGPENLKPCGTYHVGDFRHLNCWSFSFFSDHFPDL